MLTMAFISMFVVVRQAKHAIELDMKEVFMFLSQLVPLIHSTLQNLSTLHHYIQL